MIKNTLYAVNQAIVTLLVLSLMFVAIEPAVSYGATVTSQFTISQVVNTEIAFATPASNVIMSPALGGITGGTSNGATSVAVTTNNLTGYNMTIQASSSLGMLGNASSTNVIPAYITTGANGTPDYTFALNGANATKGAFGYNVNATTSTDVAQLFRSSGSTPCNTSTLTSSSACWLAATTTAVTIINRSLPTPATGATTTLSFRVQIPSNPSPMLPNDTYVATTTLTATTNP
jgi:hypothetical protein